MTPFLRLLKTMTCVSCLIPGLAGLAHASSAPSPDIQNLLSCSFGSRDELSQLESVARVSPLIVSHGRPGDGGAFELYFVTESGIYQAQDIPAPNAEFVEPNYAPQQLLSVSLPGEEDLLFILQQRTPSDDPKAKGMPTIERVVTAREFESEIQELMNEEHQPRSRFRSAEAKLTVRPLAGLPDAESGQVLAALLSEVRGRVAALPAEVEARRESRWSSLGTIEGDRPGVAADLARESGKLKEAQDKIPVLQKAVDELESAATLLPDNGAIRDSLVGKQSELLNAKNQASYSAADAAKDQKRLSDMDAAHASAAEYLQDGIAEWDLISVLSVCGRVSELQAQAASSLATIDSDRKAGRSAYRADNVRPRPTIFY